VSTQLRQDFGRLLEVRDVRRVRRVAADAWQVSVVLAAPSHELHVVDLIVEDDGSTSPTLDGDDVIEAVRRFEQSSVVRSVAPEVAEFGADFGLDDDTPDELDFAVFEEAELPIEERVSKAIARGDEASLIEARDLLPRLLTQHEQRGATLLTMAEVEVQLSELNMARGYLEAAAREFADRFDLDALERAASLALTVEGQEAFAGSAVHKLLEQSRTRLTPVATIYDSKIFRWLSEELRPRLEAGITLRTLAPGETLVQEGEPSRNVFVVKSGLVGVWLEKPSGGSWLVRCCFPGWLLGESSVLGGDDPRCTASLRAQRFSEVWVCRAELVRELMFEDLAFGHKIAETKQLHRIDSFFSMHETMGQLDVQVRDEILSCLQRLESFDEDTLILPAHQVPAVACLVARGSIALFEDGRDKPSAVIEADSFYGVRDTIHAIESGLTAIARAGSVIAFFEGTRLSKLCAQSPEHVVAVLERLG
jgi:CRP-like cAMP-binding protein